MLKAALNEAFRAGKIHSDLPWRKVKPFQKVEKAKLRYLTDDEARRLVNASDQDMRPLIIASLLTGGRYGELGAIKVQDVDLRARTVRLVETKSGHSRFVFLEDEGHELFRQMTMGKSGADLVFPRPDGGLWKASQQGRRLRIACAIGNVVPAASFHDLRRTFGARLALRGVPLSVIAKALGHADERITSRHYAHLSECYVSETIREGAAGLGLVKRSSVVTLKP